MSLYRWTVERSTSIYKLVGRVLSADQVTSQIKADLYTDRQHILTVCRHPPLRYCLYMGLKNSRQAYQVHYAKKVIIKCKKLSITKAQKRSTKTRMCYRVVNSEHPNSHDYYTEGKADCTPYTFISSIANHTSADNIDTKIKKRFAKYAMTIFQDVSHPIHK